MVEPTFSTDMLAGRLEWGPNPYLRASQYGFGFGKSEQSVETPARKGTQATSHLPKVGRRLLSRMLMRKTSPSGVAA